MNGRWMYTVWALSASFFYALAGEVRLSQAVEDYPTLRSSRLTAPSNDPNLTLSGFEDSESKPLYAAPFSNFSKLELPLLKLYTQEPLSDTLRVTANFTLYTPQGDSLSAIAGIKIRGGFSKQYPKKSYSIEFWHSAEETMEKNTSLLNMREDGDWILLSMYNEPLRTRNYLGHLLWSKIYRLTDYQKKNKAKLHIDLQYVELYINDFYQGLYLLGEKIDRKQLGLEKVKTIVRGQLYKTVEWEYTTFEHLGPYSNESARWGGFEQKYPKPLSKVDWLPFYTFTEWAISAEEDAFWARLHEFVNASNAIDYFLLINLLRATDNTGKNIYYARWDRNLPYFMIPWDLDGILGRKYDGTMENYTDDILSNGLFDKLFFKETSTHLRIELVKRWMYLRNAIFGYAYVTQLIDNNHARLIESGAFQREKLRWKGTVHEFTLERNKIVTWLKKRIEALDSFFFSLEDGKIEEFLREERIQFTLGREMEVFFFSNGYNENKFYKIVDLHGNVLHQGKIQTGLNVLPPLFKSPLGPWFLQLKGKTFQLIPHRSS
jgi:spore coat protein H